MTDYKADSPQSHREQPFTQQVMTRHNGLVFYGLSAASFLETAIPLHANALLDVFGAEPEVQRWIEQHWWPVKCAHARETRAYVEATWPEFGWSAAYGEFYEAYRAQACPRRDSRGPAREALVHSVAAAQAAAFYRCLGSAVDDNGLRQLLCRMSADESAHFASFRRLFTRLDRDNRLGLLTTYRTIVTCATRARDVDVQLAFSRLNAPHWYGGVPFPEMDYRDFVSRMGKVVRRHLPLGAAQRFLFRPWWQAPCLRPPSLPLTRPAPRARALAGRQLPANALQ